MGTATQRIRVLAIFMSIFLPSLAQETEKPGFRWNVNADNEGLWNMTTCKGAWNGLLSVDAGIEPWQNGLIEASAIATYGTGAVADDIQGLTNIDAGENRAFRFTKVGIRQQFGILGIFAGLYNVDIDYFTTPYTSMFTGSSYGNFPILSMNHPLATYPLSAMCLHLNFSPTDRLVIQESIYNGIAYDRPGDQFRVRPGKDGFFNIGSVTYTLPTTDEDFSPASYMFIYSAARLPEAENRMQMHYTLLGNIEQPIAAIRDKAMLGIMLQGGWNATRGEEICRGYAAAAVVVECRNGMTAGMAANRVFTLDGDETDVEFTYSCPLWRYLTITPSLHCIFTEGQRCNVVGMLRLSFAIGNE